MPPTPTQRCLSRLTRRCEGAVHVCTGKIRAAASCTTAVAITFHGKIRAAAGKGLAARRRGTHAAGTTGGGGVRGAAARLPSPSNPHALRAAKVKGTTRARTVQPCAGRQAWNLSWHVTTAPPADRAAFSLLTDRIYLTIFLLD